MFTMNVNDVIFSQLFLAEESVHNNYVSLLLASCCQVEELNYCCCQPSPVALSASQQAQPSYSVSVFP